MAAGSQKLDPGSKRFDPVAAERARGAPFDWPVVLLGVRQPEHGGFRSLQLSCNSLCDLFVLVGLCNARLIPQELTDDDI